ncbi:MAG: hypothetical protein K0R31_1551 [Clostridiales bacterium]|nr:hypothetical protein [Clostridiales bacterium]
MNKKFNKLIPFVMGISLFLLPLSGCATVNRNRAAPTPIPQRQGVTPPIGSNDINRLNVSENAPNMTGNAPNHLVVPSPNGTALNGTTDNRQRTDNIRNQLGNINGASQFNIAVVDNVALIGYKPTDGSTDIQATNRAITDRVKQIDPAVTNVAVSGAQDIFDKIGTLAQRMTSNMSGTEARVEANRLLQRIVPTVR